MNGRISLFVAFLFGVTGCHSVERCPYFPESDCCRTSGECFDFYGPVAPYCHAPDRDIGGTCTVCSKDGDCGPGRACVPKGSGAMQCVDRDACYEGAPWPDTTSCR